MSEQKEDFEKWWESNMKNMDCSMGEAREVWNAALSSAPSAEPIAEVVFWDEGSTTVINGMGKLIALPVGAKLYTAPPHLSAAIAAAREQDAETAYDAVYAHVSFPETAEYAADAIRAQQDPDGVAALREFGMKVAELTAKFAYEQGALTGAIGASDLVKILDRVLKGE